MTTGNYSTTKKAISLSNHFEQCILSKHRTYEMFEYGENTRSNRGTYAKQSFSSIVKLGPTSLYDSYKCLPFSNATIIPKRRLIVAILWPMLTIIDHRICVTRKFG